MFKIIFRKGKFHFVPLNSMGNGVLVLFGVVTSIHILTAAINIKKGDRNRGVKALAIARAAGTSTWVIIGIGTITMLLADITAFNSATGAERKELWRIINNTLKAIMRKFQSAMDLNPVNSHEICVSGGFSVRGVYIKQEQVFGITQGNESGTVDLIGNTCDTTHCHDWWINFNGGEFKRLKPTTDSETQARDLIPGNRYGFQHQLIMPVGEDDGPLETLYIDVI
jgi:hypothetical protein